MRSYVVKRRAHFRHSRRRRMVSPVRPSRESITLSSMLAQNGHFTRDGLLAVFYREPSRMLLATIIFPTLPASPAWTRQATRPLLRAFLLRPSRAAAPAKTLRPATAALHRAPRRQMLPATKPAPPPWPKPRPH